MATREQILEKLNGDRGFRGLVLERIDLSNLDLTHTRWNGAILEHADFDTLPQRIASDNLLAT
jgi:uncharacterized protein YjbI with pentapeptide repeats